MVTPSVKRLDYVDDLKRVIRRKFTLGVGDGHLKADGPLIYSAKELGSVCLPRQYEHAGRGLSRDSRL